MQKVLTESMSFTKGAGLRGVKTGFVDLDSTLSGMQASICLFWLPVPDKGKTAMVANISSHVAELLRKFLSEFFFGNESGRDGGQTF